ncbi:hypothetical protein D1AOALGA4SA_498 [Olavius algarvensis Delta 1 endosymbiont]|nr:hypothetical protein D1AOALGA4SA_498 [Olavius algarvensis Delta 1 endosymbiont]
MSRDSAGRLFSCLSAGFFVIVMISVIGCAGSKVKLEYENKDKTKYSKKDHKHKHKKVKPSKHAKAHGQRGKHHYHYFPSSSVYFDSGRKLYFYLSHGRWEVGSSLPKNIRAGLGDYVKLELNTGMPYTYHADHCKQYPPGKKKKKKDKKKHKYGRK